jgi:hypothetical protein
LTIVHIYANIGAFVRTIPEPDERLYPVFKVKMNDPDFGSIIWKPSANIQSILDGEEPDSLRRLELEIEVERSIEQFFITLSTIAVSGDAFMASIDDIQATLNAVGVRTIARMQR